jgi:unsaturated chondroitin disaccharide hydrolase
VNNKKQSKANKIFHMSNRFTLTLLACLLFTMAGTAQKKQQLSGNQLTAGWIDDNLKPAAEQYKYLATRVPDGVMPRSFTRDTLRTCTSENWVAGFYPGTLLYLYEATGDKALYAEALKKIPLMDKEQYNKGTHDLGFMMYCSYGNLNRISPNEAYKKILVNAARSLASRFNPTVGCIRSWGRSDDTTMFRVIIDNMMNLELLFWAARETGDQSLYNIAVTHAETTMKNHFRPDYSSYHVVVYNPQTGAVMQKQTAQGAADSSAWARGQSWGLYGYTLLYRETKNRKYLAQAQHIADFILNNPHLPADKIPYWDYDAPGIPDTYRDASAAAVMASALIELSGYSNNRLAKQYLAVAETILRTLSSAAYKAKKGENGGFILKHSVAHFPKQTEVDSPLPYADYYYVEAMTRYKKKFNAKKTAN